MNTITSEQKKLKNMLKKMNSDTMKMLDGISPKKIQVVPKRNTSDIIKVADEEMNNNTKIKEYCQKEIAKLQDRS